MKQNNIIKDVSDSYVQYRRNCEKVAKEAQIYIDWDNDIGCECFPGDGVCLTTSDASVCPVSSFFSMIEKYGIIDEDDFKRICI